MRIELWWIGQSPPDQALLEHAREPLAAAFSAQVHLAARAGIPPDAFDARRGQWSSGRILKWLLDSSAQDAPEAGRVLGVTDRDLFIPVLTFVFGEAQLGGKAAVVSLARLKPAPGEPAKPGLVAARFLKECVHELGHTYGLVHCSRRGCAMGRASSVVDVDTKTSVLCEDCRGKMRDYRG